MNPKNKHIMTYPGQTKLDGFFAKYRKDAVPKASSASPTVSIQKSPRKEPRTSAPAAVLPVNTTLPLSPKRPVKPVSSTKRPYDGDSDSDDGIVPIPVRPRKSPRTSPQPESIITQSRHNRQSSSSSLSPLKSPTSLPPSIQRSVEPRTMTSNSFRPISPVRNRPSVKPESRPQTSESHRSTITSSFGSNHTSAPSSSSRVVKNGQEMVLNSDSEGSDDSLMDLDDLLGPAKPAVKASSPLTELSRTPTPPADILETGTRRLRSATPISAGSSIKGGPLPKSNLRFSLAALVERSQQQEAEKAKVAETLKAIADLEKSDSPPRQGASNDGQVESVLKGVGAEADDTARLLEALTRTEAMVQDKHWSFFDYSRFQRRLCERSLVPLDRSGHFAGDFLLDEDQVREMLVCGYGKHLVKTLPVTQGFGHWLFQHALYDRRGDVRSACVQALACDKTLPIDYIAGLVHTELKNMGMRDDATGLQARPIATEKSFAKESAAAKSGVHVSALQQLLALITASASTLSLEAASEVVITLARLGVDDHVSNDAKSMTILSAGLSSCLDIFSHTLEGAQALQDVLEALCKQTEDDEFRLRILDGFSQSNMLASSVRRKLATAWFYEDTSLLHHSLRPFRLDSSAPDPPLLEFERIHGYMKKHGKIFKISRNTDWNRLKPKLELLVIAIGNGDPPVSLNEDLQGSSFEMARTKARETAKAYNEAVDRLIHLVNHMYSLIVDKGTSLVSRTEVKDILERLKAKLTYTVRTKPPVRKNVFDVAGGDIRKFLKAKGDAGKAASGAVTSQSNREAAALQRTHTPATEDLGLGTPTQSASEYHDAMEIAGDRGVRSETEFESAHESPPT